MTGKGWATVVIAVAVCLIDGIARWLHPSWINLYLLGKLEMVAGLAVAFLMSREARARPVRTLTFGFGTCLLLTIVMGFAVAGAERIVPRQQFQLSVDLICLIGMGAMLGLRVLSKQRR